MIDHPSTSRWQWRRVQPDEAEDFLRVSLETFHAAFRVAYAAHEADYDTYVRDTYTLTNIQSALSDPDQHIYWLITGKDIAGFVRFGANPQLKCLPQIPLVEIKRFYMYPGYHGQGGASWLMQQVAQWARDR
ncbi:MAG: GNAT family N-acetyltransferase, partial [Bacteroidota bacterium]